MGVEAAAMQAFQTAKEIRRWRKLTGHQRRRIMDEARQRRARLDRSHPSSVLASMEGA